jgi:hypothetical protein
VASMLALNFFPDPEAAVKEMRSLCSPHGTVSACVWDYAGGMEFLRGFWDAVVAMDPTAQQLDEGKRFPLCHPEALTDVFRAATLVDVRCDPIETETRFASFEEYWRPFLAGVGPAPSYVASLSADRCAALASKIEVTLRREPGTPIALRARAWAVRGTVGG